MENETVRATYRIVKAYSDIGEIRDNLERHISHVLDLLNNDIEPYNGHTKEEIIKHRLKLAMDELDEL